MAKVREKKMDNEIYGQALRLSLQSPHTCTINTHKTIFPGDVIHVWAPTRISDFRNCFFVVAYVFCLQFFFAIKNIQ